MLFNSYEFLIFLPLVWFVYWVLLRKTMRGQNLLLLVASYVFYGWWDWRFLGLIALSSIVDFIAAQKIHQNTQKSKRKAWLWLSIGVNLSVLLFFKYYNFFASSLVNAFDSLNIYINPFTLQVLLPVGISFYTFQTMSYSIDVYHKKLEPSRDWIEFFAFVSFFPQLVAGPIERARHLLPQFYKKREFDYKTSADGLRQILWGMFKKVVIADSLAPSVDYIYSHYHEVSAGALILGTVFFAIQVYGDFSGYSDIAIGTARLFGFDLMTNFRTPYFSKSLAEFWRRWHISLSTWFRDYLYIPLGGNRHGIKGQAFNMVVVFTVSGLWHGAEWTFVLWGLLHGVYLAQSLFWQRYVIKGRKIKNKWLAKINGVAMSLKIFGVMCISYVFFRTLTLQHAWGYFKGMLNTENFFEIPKAVQGNYHLYFIIALLVIDLINEKQDHQFKLGKVPQVFRWLIYLIVSVLILQYFGSSESFIYFQF